MIDLTTTVEKKSYPKIKWKHHIITYPGEKVQIDIKDKKQVKIHFIKRIMDRILLQISYLKFSML